MKRLLVAMAIAAACTGSREESRTPAAQGAPPAEASPAPIAAPAPIAEPPPRSDAGVGAQVGKDAPEKTDPSAVTPPAAQMAQAEPPLMPDAAFRAKPPPPLAQQPHFDPPVPLQRKLKNGARVLIVENRSLPLVAIEVRFLYGVDGDPKEKPGLAEFVSDMVDEGTKSRSAAKFAEEVEDLAAHLSAGTSLETSNVHLNCLTETLPKALELMADVVQNPAFRPEDVERVRVLKLTALEQKKANPGALAADQAARILYGPQHPWGQPAGGTPESIASITPADLAAFHARFWVPNDAVISVAGDVKADAVVRLLNEKFASWKRRLVSKQALPALPKLARREIFALEKAGTTQAQVWVVGHLFKATDPDAIPLRVANMTLGGLFTSRLNMNLREKHGYSYGVGSSVTLMRRTGSFSARGGIVAQNTVQAVAEYENELENFSSGTVTREELAAAKEALIRGLPANLETNDAVSSAMTNLVSLGLPLDYYRTYAARVGRVSQADVKRVATRWIKPARWPVVIVGPIAQSKEALEKLNLGPVSIAPAVPGGKPAASAP